MVIYLKSLSKRPLLRPGSSYHMNEASITGLCSATKFLSYLQNTHGALFGDWLTVDGLIVFLKLLGCLPTGQ
jgi:hypothetical protein